MDSNFNKATTPYHVVYLGETGFPVGLGAIQKLMLVSKAMIQAGAKVTVICRKGSFDPQHPVDYAPQGNVEGVHYTYPAGHLYRPASFLQRNWRKLVGIYHEFSYLRQLHHQQELDAAIVSCYSFVQVLLYRLYATYFRIPLVLNYVEMLSAIQHREGLFLKINDYLYDKFMVASMDGALPISEVLIENYQRIAPHKPYLKIPVICDFAKFDINTPPPATPYILYCGALDYRELVDFILECYADLKTVEPVELHFVLGGGNQSSHQNLLDAICQHPKAELIRVFWNVPHANIPQHYANATALLIPLRPTKQDAARFPHKVGEYIASGNPMVTTNYGEIAMYFEDGKTALVASEYSVEHFTKKLTEVFTDPQRVQSIGQRGKAFGLAEFNYLSYGDKLIQFLKNIKSTRHA